MDGSVIKNKKKVAVSSSVRFSEKKVVGSFFIITYCICKPMLCKKRNKNCGINCLLKSWTKDVVSPCLSLLGTKCHVQMKTLIKKNEGKSRMTLIEWEMVVGWNKHFWLSCWHFKYKRQKKLLCNLCHNLKMICCYCGAGFKSSPEKEVVLALGLRIF